MKKALAIIVVMLIPTMTMAENPDSRPSINFAIGGDLASGRTSYRGFNQPLDGKDFYFSGGLSLPVSTDVTLKFKLGFATGVTDWERTERFYDQNTDYTSFGFDFKVTFYIGDSINK